MRGKQLSNPRLAFSNWCECVGGAIHPHTLHMGWHTSTVSRLEPLRFSSLGCNGITKTVQYKFVGGNITLGGPEEAYPRYLSHICIYITNSI